MPEVQQVHIDAALTNLSVAYRNNEFIAEQLAPRVAVRKQSDRYYTYDGNREALRTTADLRSPGSIAGEVDYTLSSDSYYCEDHALSSAIPDEERENADPAIQPDMDRTEFLTERILLNQEVALEKMMRETTAIEEVGVGPGEEWTSDASDPVAVVQDARLQVFAGCQRRANLMVLPSAAYEALRVHPAIIDRIKYSSLGVVTADLLAQLFDVDRVLVPRSYVNTATAGSPPTVTELWQPNVYLLHVAPRPGLKQVTFASTFVWSGMPGSTEGTLVERWRDSSRKADLVRVQKYYDTKIIAPGAAIRIASVVS